MPYKDPDKQREWERKHRKQYRKEHPEVGFNAAMSVWKKNPTRVHIRQVVYYAIKSGILTRPNICESCGRENCVIEAHHTDYSKPLEVKWLCRQCHRIADRARQSESGEKPINARKLTDEQVREIRRSDDTDRSLAMKYGISNCAINKIRNRLTYKDVV